MALQRGFSDSLLSMVLQCSESESLSLVKGRNILGLLGERNIIVFMNSLESLDAHICQHNKI